MSRDVGRLTIHEPVALPDNYVPESCFGEVVSSTKEEDVPTKSGGSVSGKGTAKGGRNSMASKAVGKGSIPGSKRTQASKKGSTTLPKGKAPVSARQRSTAATVKSRQQRGK